MMFDLNLAKMKMMAKHSAGISSAVGMLPAASLTNPMTGVTMPPPIMVITIMDEPYLVSWSNPLIPKEKMVGYWIDINMLHSVSAIRPTWPPAAAEMMHNSMEIKA